LEDRTSAPDPDFFGNALKSRRGDGSIFAKGESASLKAMVYESPKAQ